MGKRKDLNLGNKTAIVNIVKYFENEKLFYKEVTNSGRKGKLDACLLAF